MGCLIEDHGALFLPQLFQVCGALVAVHGEKALKGKACGVLSGDGKGSDCCRRSGNNFHRHAQLVTELYQRLARVGDAGHSGIGDNAAGVAGKDAVGDALRHRQSAVFVIADDGRVDVIMGQELSGHTGILCRQKVHLTQQPQLTHGDVLQVADGCADDV